MKFVLFGLPCAGKTYQINKINNLEKINGSELLNKLSNNKFEELTVLEKQEKRNELLNYIKYKDNFIIDGHVLFPVERFPNLIPANIVFTEKDANAYDVYFYLYTDPKLIEKRMKESDKNKKYSNVDIKKWQEIEIKKLEESCRKYNKDFYIIDNVEFFDEFVNEILKGYSNINKAKEIAAEIINENSDLELNLIDGDKTIVKQDTSRYILNYKTNIFNNDFYTGYQFFLQNKEMQKYENIIIPDNLIFNKVLLDKIKNKYNILISSGNSFIWNQLGKKLNFNKIFTGYDISGETKYFICKFLKEKFKINAYGDSKNDLPMLKCANNGYLVYFNRLSRSLTDMDIRNINTMFCEPYILQEKIDNLEDLIEKTKSNSGISGNELANTHFKLGEILGETLKSSIDENKTTIVSILRGGLFISNGIYSKFNGHYQLYNDKTDKDFGIENKNDETIILIDSVINSGNTILKLIDKIEKNNINIIIIAVVIQEEALKKLDKYQILTIRTSKNKFIGAKVKKQTGNKGPDTSDRLFNML